MTGREPEPSGRPDPGDVPSWGAWLGLVLLVALSTWARVDTALRDPQFDAQRAEGLLKSDPALLFAFTEWIVAAGGGVPAGFRANPRVQHPGTTDLPAEFTVGQEFLVAWAHLLFGGDGPLHVSALWSMSLTASLAVVGLFLLVQALLHASSRPRTWALFACVLYVLLPANYRTIGFLLVREDLAFPLFALHLGLLARALRCGTSWSWRLAGIAGALALATWHAMAFFVGLELLVILGVCLLSEPRGVPGSRTTLALLEGPLVVALLVPALRESVLLFSPSFALLAGCVTWAVCANRAQARSRRVGLSVLAVGVWLALSSGLRQVGIGRGHDHVWEMLLAKLRYLGALPTDPNALSFDARLLWQGPFATLDLAHGWSLVSWALVLGALGALLLLWTPQRGQRVLVLLTLVSIPVAWLIARAIILPGLLLPAVASVGLARSSKRRAALGLAGVTALLAASGWSSFLAGHRIGWYQPPGRQAEIRALVEWVRQNVPPDEPIVADFMNSTAILAHAGNPIVLQPKYETERSRRAAERFLWTYFHGTPQELAELVRGEFEARYLLLDRYTLGILSPYTAGLARGQAPAIGTAAHVFQQQDQVVLDGVPGFHLVYRSPPDILQRNGEPYDFFRLYRLTPGAEKR